MPARTLARFLPLVAALAFALTGCQSGDAYSEDSVAGVATLDVADGVSFLPPIGTAEATRVFDREVDLSIEIFAIDETSGSPNGGPLGPSFAVSDGTLEVVRGDGTDDDGFYRAVWKTRDSGVDDGTAVRIEVRLGNAPEGSPACVDPVTYVEGGCLGYVDARLRKNLGQGPTRGRERAAKDGGMLQLRNGQALPIRIHVREGAANTPPTVEILEPADGSRVGAEQEVTFLARAIDLEDGDLSGSVAWSSDLDGSLGTGAAATTGLSVGTHTITAAVTDGGGRDGAASVTVTVVGVPEPEWRADIGGTVPTGAWGYGPVAMRGGGVVSVVQGPTNGVVAFGADGSEKFRISGPWNYGLGPLSVGPDGSIYGSRSRDNAYTNTALVSIAPNGDEVWSYPSAGPLFGTPAVAADGTLWSGGYNNQFWSHDPSGSLLTSAAIPLVRTPPVIGSDGSVYVGRLYEHVHKIDPATGSIAASATLPGVSQSNGTGLSAAFSLAPTDDETLLLVPSFGSAARLFALDASDLSTVWSVPGLASTRPVIVGDGLAYVADDHDGLVAVDLTDGAVLWSRANTGLPSLAANGLLYAAVGTELCALDPDGVVVSCRALNGQAPRAPVIAPTGELYVVAGTELFRLNAGTGGPAATPWPLYYADPYGTRRLD